MVKSAGTQIHWRIVMKSETLRRMWALCAGALIFAAGSSARAQDAGGMACLNDIDCPEPACGGQVCDYNKGPSCTAAGAAKKGMDGWCTTVDDCKCKGTGRHVQWLSTARSRFPKMHHLAAARAELADLRQLALVVRQRLAPLETRPPAAPPADSGGCSIASTPAAGLGAAGLLVGLGAIAFGARRRRRAA